jgi:hypothetical protein
MIYNPLQPELSFDFCCMRSQNFFYRLLGISFTPKEVGDHFVSVFRNGQPIPGSPFKVVVGRNEIGDASKVRVGGRGLTQATTNELNDKLFNALAIVW